MNLCGGGSCWERIRERGGRRKMVMMKCSISRFADHPTLFFTLVCAQCGHVLLVDHRQLSAARVIGISKNGNCLTNSDRHFDPRSLWLWDSMNVDRVKTKVGNLILQSWLSNFEIFECRRPSRCQLFALRFFLPINIMGLVILFYAQKYALKSQVRQPIESGKFNVLQWA